MEEQQFSDGIDKITKLLEEELETLEEDGVKYTRTKLKEIDKICKQKYQIPKGKIIKNFLSALKNKIPEKENVIKTLKKIKKVRIVVKED